MKIKNKINIKCIVIDIDGTLLNSKKQISSYTKQIINKLIHMNIIVILASGRNIDDSIKISKECGAGPIIIANNGAVIYDYCKKQFLLYETISKLNIRFIFNLCSTYGIDSIYNSLHLRYRNYINLDKKYNEKTDKVIESINNITEDVYQIILLGIDDKSLKLCLNQVINHNLIINNIGTGQNKITFADINSKGVSKGSAIKKVSKKLNIQKNSIMCFGDSFNDLLMFKNCGISVAMKNGVNKIKQYSNYITQYSNNEDGVAKFLESYFNLF